MSIRSPRARWMRPASALLLAGLLCAPGALGAAEKKYEKIKAPKLREITVPPVTRVTLDNGMQVFVVEDHDLPLFRMTLTLKAGGAYDPPDRLGLASITAGVVRSGGSTVLPGDRMDEVLESMGGSIESGADALTTTVSVNVLVEDTDKALEMLRDLLRQPAFPPDKVDLELKQWRSTIARRNDDPMEIADREMEKILYGADHPFARQVEYDHLSRITRDDLVDYHRRYYHPTDAYLAVWGDFDTQAVLERIRAILGAWPRAEVTYPAIPPVPATVPSVNLAVKESVNQSNIRIGHRGTTQQDPDYYALAVMNEILGGSFGARLFNEVRSRQGLAYGVRSSLGAGLTYPGMFEVSVGTKSETTVQAARSCIEEVRKMKTQPVTAEELARAKAGILNSHVFNYTNKGAIVNRQVTYVRNGYPPDFLDRFVQGIEMVTVGDVQRAAGKYLQPDQMALLVVGRPQDFGEPLAALGAVKTLDLTIPEPPVTETTPAATPETLAKGKETMEAAAKAMGGAEALRKVAHVTEQGSVTLTMMGQSIGGKLTRYATYPNNTRAEIEVMGQKMVQVYNGAEGSGYQAAGGRTQPMDAGDLEDAKSELARDLIECVRNAANYSPQWLAETTVNGALADVVLLSPPGLVPFKVVVDRKTRLVVKQEYRGKNFQGAPVQEELLFEDYRKAGALLLPYKTTVLQDGQPAMATQTTSFSWDAVPAEKFRKEG